MILVRNVFRLKFGKAREAREAMKALIAINRRLGFAHDARMLTDVSGPFYTLVLEMSFPSMVDLERAQSTMSDAGWKDGYARFVPLVESGHREIFSVVE